MNDQLIARHTSLDTSNIESIRPQPAIVGSLEELLRTGNQFKTVLADPPWQYDNTASRAAAENHYSRLSVEEICREPVGELVGDNAHLQGRTS